MNQSLAEKLCSDVVNGWTEEKMITRQFENFQQSVEGYTPRPYQVSFFSIPLFLCSSLNKPLLKSTAYLLRSYPTNMHLISSLLSIGSRGNENISNCPRFSNAPPPSVVQYTVGVTTGKRAGSGTDADVYLCIAGERGDTGDRWLRKSTSGINKFERGDVSIIKSYVSVGRIGYKVPKT